MSILFLAICQPFKAIDNIIWFRFNCTPKNIWLWYYHVIQELFLCLSCRTAIFNLTRQLGLTFASATVLGVGTVELCNGSVFKVFKQWNFSKLFFLKLLLSTLEARNNCVLSTFHPLIPSSFLSVSRLQLNCQQQYLLKSYGWGLVRIECTQTLPLFCGGREVFDWRHFN